MVFAMRGNGTTPSYKNEGNVPLYGVIELEVDPLYQDYQVGTPIDSIVDNKFYYSFEELLPGQLQSVNIGLLRPTDEFIGTTLVSHVRVYGYHEMEYVAYGEDTMEEELTCAVDPNDKQVFPNGYEEPHFILNETELEYLIRFQNTGNAPAINVWVTDTIDDNFDLDSFELLTYSHSVMTTIKTDERVIEYYFEDIMLPDSTNNEPDSHGFISYRIDPYPDLEIGTELNNTANIYFDNNAPVITNTTWNTIYECTQELASIDLSEDMICLNETITVENSEAYVEDYQWSWEGQNIGNESSIEPLMDSTGSHYILLEVSNPLCSVLDSVLVNVAELPALETIENQEICLGDEVTIEASSDDTIEWEGFGIGDTQTVSPTQTTTYVATATNDADCSTSAELVVTVNDVPDAEFSADNNLLTATSVGTYQWYLNGSPIDGATTQSIEITEDGIYSVEVTNEWDCSAFSDEQFVSYVGVDSYSVLQQMVVYPNPAKDQVTIELPFGECQIRIFDVNGQLVQEVRSSTDKLSLDVSQWANGMYEVVVVKASGHLANARIVIE